MYDTYHRDPGTSASALAATTTVAPTGSVGRVWSMALAPTTAAACTWLLSSGATNIWSIQAPAAVGQSATAYFPTGLLFTNGLVATEVAGVGVLSLNFTIDRGANTV